MNNEILKELTAMKECGITVKKTVFTHVKNDDLSEYNNMSISDIADLMIDLHG